MGIITQSNINLIKPAESLEDGENRMRDMLELINAFDYEEILSMFQNYIFEYLDKLRNVETFDEDFDNWVLKQSSRFQNYVKTKQEHAKIIIFHILIENYFFKQGKDNCSFGRNIVGLAENGLEKKYIMSSLDIFLSKLDWIDKGILIGWLFGAWLKTYPAHKIDPSCEIDPVSGIPIKAGVEEELMTFLEYRWADINGFGARGY